MWSTKKLSNNSHRPDFSLLFAMFLNGSILVLFYQKHADYCKYHITVEHNFTCAGHKTFTCRHLILTHALKILFLSFKGETTTFKPYYHPLF